MVVAEAELRVLHCNFLAYEDIAQGRIYVRVSKIETTCGDELENK